MSCTGFSFALFLNFLSLFVSFSQSIRSAVAMPPLRRDLPQNPSKFRSFLFFSFFPFLLYVMIFALSVSLFILRMPALSLFSHFPILRILPALRLQLPHSAVASPFCCLAFLSPHSSVVLPSRSFSFFLSPTHTKRQPGKAAAFPAAISAYISIGQTVRFRRDRLPDDSPNRSIRPHTVYKEIRYQIALPDQTEVFIVRFVAFGIIIAEHLIIGIIDRDPARDSRRRITDKLHIGIIQFLHRNRPLFI